MAWPERGRPRRRFVTRLILVFIALMQSGFAVPNDIGSENIAGLAKADRLVRGGYCRPEYEPVLECPAPEVEKPDHDDLWPLCVALIIGAAVVGYLVGLGLSPIRRTSSLFGLELRLPSTTRSRMPGLGARPSRN
jgi:hypothetical protein